MRARRPVGCGHPGVARAPFPRYLSALAQQVWGIAEAEGGPGRDMTSLIQSYENWTGIQVGGPPAEEQ